MVCQEFLERPEFLEAFLNSAKFAALAALFSVIFGTLGALGIAKYDISGKIVYYGPFNFSIKCAAISLRDCTLNVLYTNDACHCKSTGFLIAHIVICIPYVMRLVLTGLSGFDYNLGKGFGHTWSQSTNGIHESDTAANWIRGHLGGLFAFLTSFDNVTVSLFMVSPEMRTLPIEIFSQMQDAYDQDRRIRVERGYFHISPY